MKLMVSSLFRNLCRPKNHARGVGVVLSLGNCSSFANSSKLGRIKFGSINSSIPTINTSAALSMRSISVSSFFSTSFSVNGCDPLQSESLRDSHKLLVGRWVFVFVNPTFAFSSHAIPSEKSIIDE